MSFDPGDPSPKRFTGYGLAAIPDARDVELDAYVRELRRGGPAAVRAAIDAASERGRRVLATYAERAASNAVREHSSDRLVLALIALVVGGLDQNALEALMRMSLIDDASKRLGVELADLFEQAADVVGHPGTVNLMIWLSRRPEDRTPECMGFEAVGGDSTFRYRWKA